MLTVRFNDGQAYKSSKDESLEASANRPDPDVIAQEINKCGVRN